MLRVARSRPSIFPFRARTTSNSSLSAGPFRACGLPAHLPERTGFTGREVKLQAKYVARWAQSFLGLGDSIVTTIPVGDVAYLSPDGRFRLSVPDFSQDPLAGAPDHPGELQIWATDQASDGIVALLIPAGPQVIKTRMGGLKIRSEYPSEIVFAPCAANPPQVHDAIGFATRPGPSDACDR